MKTKIVKIENENLLDKALIEAATILKDGGLVVFPTETVYGLGANALNSKAVQSIFEAKGRPQDNPLIIHVANKNIDFLVSEITSFAKKLMDKFWPGPLTLIMKKSDIVPNVTSAGLETVGIRMPSNLIARQLIESAGVPIAAPSANLSGKPSPTTLESCVEDLKGRVDFIIGGEMSKVGLESTIVDCTVDPPCVLRPGGITLEMLKTVDERVYIDSAILNNMNQNEKPRAPGMKYRHYAPNVPMKIISGDLDNIVEYINKMCQEYRNNSIKVGIIATEETKNSYSYGIIKSLGTRKDLNTVSYNLFNTLRSFNNEDVDLILGESFLEEGIGIAIMNRLKKAAGYDIIKV
ncbi:L-threonylcarbamoyladenylate synthase [Clostridium grantii]|uniref:Threonylcarbamoyl-AMP synthase n=1 Tax=Clostridium grantii DSM 8605 TaxID=1121316 RepID=A0A1M5TK02_9CLOT|nr:L-threonylcarbamoyladenylate synthase [Clostridium grantii]SHH51008.1 L-threonylcarbamoyladenylate synthase [Clostridium grantii DSM 8605]